MTETDPTNGVPTFDTMSSDPVSDDSGTPPIAPVPTRPDPAGDHSVASDDDLPTLSPLEISVLRVLHDAAGRVVSRRELARQVGIADRHERRCDSVLVGLRRHLGPDAIVTVRSRGWMLQPAVRDRVSLLIGDGNDTPMA